MWHGEVDVDVELTRMRTDEVDGEARFNGYLIGRRWFGLKPRDGHVMVGFFFLACR